MSCTPISLDQYGRTVATCSVASADLGEWLVRNGLALDWPQYSKGKHAAAQRDAEHAGRGMGQAAMLSHGFIGPASGRTGVRRLARMMRTRIRDECKDRRAPKRLFRPSVGTCQATFRRRRAVHLTGSPGG
ncbi:thermonuclease family protein [Bradyrhizobium sp. AZCC 2289]|uniref:thermonuclease family protein n=1 Tax=Bradyrhizobium sp. AZCC 2289 TaxID=3117026 RepID=UPI002FF1F571